MESLFKTWTDYLALGIEAAAAVVIGLAAIEATVRALYLFTQPNLPPESKELVRLRLGRWLSLALELLVAADILHTAVTPTFDEVKLLAAIVALRTVLNFFLERDIEKAAARQENVPA